MTARLLANLGVVQECLKKYEKGVDLVLKSIDICKDNDLFEHLERSYKILGSLYMRKKEYGNAIDSYNRAISTAGIQICIFACLLKRFQNCRFKLIFSLCSKSIIRSQKKLTACNIVKFQLEN